MLTESELMDYLQEPLEKHVGYQLRRVAMQIQADLTRELKPLNLIPGAASILLVLANQKDVIQMDLSHLLGIKRTNISPMVVSLEKRGLVSRSSLDGRSQYVELTAQGNKQLPNIELCLERHADNCFSVLSSKELSALSKALNTTQSLLDPRVESSEKASGYQQLSYLIIRTSSLAMSKLVKDLSILDLIPTNASAMMMLVNNPGINQSNLGRRLGIKRANISTLVSELKARKLVDAQVKGRTQKLSLSEAGGLLVKNIAQILAQHERYCFAHINKPKEIISALLPVREQLSKRQ
jgi:DNA-binding MarR family transcriptional regulator